MKYRAILILGVLFILTSSLSANEIVSVNAQPDRVQIQFREKPDYRVLPQDDPFRLKIEVYNAGVGVLSKKFFFHDGVVSEISSFPTDRGILLEILLTEPLRAKVTSGGDSIFINLEESKSKRVPKIVDILYEENQHSYEISIRGDSILPEPEVVKGKKALNLIFTGIELATDIPKELPLKLSKRGDRVVLSFHSIKDSHAEVFYLGDEVIIEVIKAREEEDFQAKLASKGTTKGAQRTNQTSEINDVSIQSQAQKSISLDLFDADIVGVLMLLGEVSGYNIVIHPEVRGKITLKLKDVPWTKVLEILCRTFHLERVFDGNIIRVAPVRVFQEEKKLLAETKDLFKKTEETETRVIRLLYAAPDKVKAAIEGAKILSPQGTIAIDERTRSVIVKDIPESLRNIENFIKNLDKPTKQILLEAKIVEISSSLAKSLGFEWGIKALPHYTTGASILLKPGEVEGPTASFNLGFLDASGTLALNFKLSALQTSGKGKVISNPRVITLNNQKAKIVQGESIPYGELDVQSGKVSTRFKDVAITIEATPNLIDDRSMQLDLTIIKEDLLGFINIGGVQAPNTAKIESSTKVILNNGETLVIGGIYKIKDSISDSKVPLLGDIPLIGELFKSTGRKENLYEVMIFITPRILSSE